MRPFDSLQGPRILHNGRKIINLSSNNYLGIAGSAELAQEAVNAIKDWGVGTSGSRLICGTTGLHTKLEEEIARFKGEEAALAFNCGYVANVSTIPPLSSNKITIYSDSLNHASVIDGCRLSKARVEVYRHLDTDDLQKRVELSGEGMIITDGVFSMTGEVAPLVELRRIADDHNLLLYVDDAHGTGVLGKHGRGTAEHFNVNVDVNMGTLSKAVGAQGGFVASSKERVDFLANTARGFIYSTAFPAASPSHLICKPDKQINSFNPHYSFFVNGYPLLSPPIDLTGAPPPLGIGPDVFVFVLPIMGDDKSTHILDRVDRFGGSFIPVPGVPPGS